MVFFYLGEKQGMIVNDDSSWYNRVGDFLMPICEGRKCMVRDQLIKYFRVTALIYIYIYIYI